MLFLNVQKKRRKKNIFSFDINYQTTNEPEFIGNRKNPKRKWIKTPSTTNRMREKKKNVTK